MVDRLASAGLPAVAVIAADPVPGDLALLVAGPGSGVLLWVGLQVDGALVTFSQPLSGAPAERETWLAVADRAVAVLDASDIRTCPASRVEGLPPEAKSFTEALAAGLNSRPVPGRPTSDPRVEQSDLQAVVNIAAMALMLVYLVLVLSRAAIGARRRPLDAGIAIGLALLAFGVRWLSSTRVPIGVANGDLSHIVDLEQWGRSGLGSVLGVTYPPAWRGLLHLLFQAVGPSLDLAFGLTTVTGALVAVPVYLLGRRLGGSPWAGALAGLAFVAYPTAIFFANGFGLEVPASAFLVLGFVHLLDWLDGRRPLDAALYVLSLTLFVQTRLEGLGAAPVLVAMHLLVALRAVGWRPLLRLVPWALAAAVAAAPFALLVLGQTLKVDANASKASSMLLPAAVFLALTVLTALDSRRFADAARRWAGEAPLRTAFVFGAMAWFLAMVVTSWPNNPLWPSNVMPDGLPYYELHVTWPYGRYPDDRIHPQWLVQAGVFPLPFLVAWFLSLLPAREGRAFAFPPMVAFLALLPWFGHYLTRYVGTGIAPVEGMRHHILFTGAVSVSVGLGAWRVARWVASRVRFPAVACAVAVLLLLSPILTHRSYFADTDFDSQREYRFAREALSRLPDRALILVPDDLVDFGPDAMIPPREIHRVYRTRDLWVGVGWPAGKDFEVEALRTALAQGVPTDVPVFFYQGLECRRAVHPLTVLPSCRVVAEVAGGRTAVSVRFDNRPYSSQSADRIGILGPHVDLALHRLSSQDLDEIARRLGPPSGEGDSP